MPPGQTWKCLSTKKHLALTRVAIIPSQLCCCLVIASFLMRFFISSFLFLYLYHQRCFCSDYLKLVHFLIQVKIVNLSFKILKNVISTLHFVSWLILVPRTIHMFELHRETLFFANLPKEFADEKLFPVVSFFCNI